MCTMEGFDVRYGEKGVTIAPHFCRVYGDCGGSFDFETAKKEVVDFYRRLADNIEKAKDYDEYCVVCL